MRSVNVIFRDPHMLISITHETTDPANWVLHQWKVSWWRKQQVLCRWFIDREQAIRYAERLKEVYTAGLSGRD